MAKKTTVEQMTEDKELEIFDIASAISKMELIDSGQSKKSKENTVSICECDYLETPPGNETADNQQLKIPDNVSSIFSKNCACSVKNQFHQ